MDKFTNLVFNSFKKLILEQDPTAGAPIDPAAAVGAPPVDPAAAGAPPPPPPSAQPTPPTPEAPKSANKVMMNLSLVSIDAFNDWVDGSTSNVDKENRKELKNAYKRFYDFMQLYKQALKTIKKTNENLISPEQKQGVPPIETTTL